MSELMGLGPLVNWPEVGQLLFRLLLDLSVTAFVIHGVYLRLYRKREWAFTCYSFNLVTLCLCLLLRRGQADIGFALTLFGVFGILRYRTEQIAGRDLTYLFIVIGLGIVNGVSGRGVSLAELLLVNGAIAAMIAILEPAFRGATEQSTPMLYDRLALLQPGRESALIEDITARTGLAVVRVETQRIDLLRDAAEITIHFRLPGC